MADDVIDKLIAQLYAAAPELGPDRIRAIAVKLRHDMGGRREYVRAEPAAGKAIALAESLAAGVSLREAIEHAGLRPGTGYARRFVMRWGFA
jgi:hypothetical protein